MVNVDLTSRAYQRTDAPVLAALLNHIEEQAGGHPWFQPERLHSTILSQVQDSTVDTRLVFAADGALVGAAVVPTPPEGGFRIDLTGGVHPDWRSRGIGRSLLGWQLSRAAEIHSAADPDVGWEAHAQTESDDGASARLFRRLGMTPTRYWYAMTSPTGQAQALAPPDGLRMETYTPAHEAAVHAAHLEAFVDHWGYQQRSLSDWATLTVRADAFLPELSLVAFDGDTAAGYLLCYRDATPGRVYVSHLGVRRSWRRRGLASALLSTMLGAARPAGFSITSIEVESAGSTGPIALYERVGFTHESLSVTYTIPLSKILLS